MTKPIFIDLREGLTDENIAKALPTRGKCFYAAPCIIGAMMKPADRRRLDDANDDANIESLILDGSVQFAAGQSKLAQRLQEAFDNPRADFDDVVAYVRHELELLP